MISPSSNAFAKLRNSWLACAIFFFGTLNLSSFFVLQFVDYPIGFTFPIVISYLATALFFGEPKLLLLPFGKFSKPISKFFENFVFGFVLIFVFFLILLFFGVSTNFDNFSLSIFVRSTINIFFSSLNEELIFRGVLFQILLIKKSEPFAISVFSIIFSLAHIFNPAISPISLINIFLASVVISVLFIRTYSFWAPLGFHFGWNFWSAYLIDSNVSGISVGIGFFRTQLSELPQFLFGGGFGIEGGLITTILLVLFGYFAFKKNIPIPEIYSRFLLYRFTGKEHLLRQNTN